MNLSSDWQQMLWNLHIEASIMNVNSKLSKVCAETLKLKQRMIVHENNDLKWWQFTHHTLSMELAF